MVGETLRFVYVGTTSGTGKTLADDLIVDSPANILGPSLSAIRPPSVLLSLGIHFPERIDIALLVEQSIEPRALLGQEPGVFPIRLPVTQIDFLVRNVPIATQDVVAFPPTQLAQMRQKTLEKAELRSLSIRAGSPGGKIQGHHGQLAEASFQVAPFTIEFVNPEAADHFVRLLPAIKCDSGVARPLGVVKVAVKSRDIDIVALQLGLLGFGFLQADDVRLLVAQPREGSLAGSRADAIRIQGDDAHRDMIPAMSTHQSRFLALALARSALRFGKFTLKSGRESPYFFNAGLFNDGESLAILGQCYAAALAESCVEYDMLFGPAYKGIPLVSTTAIALAETQQRNVGWCFNRKEAKTHGEGGQIVGTPLAGRVVIVDDVITAGTAIRESVEIIRAAGAQPVAVLLALDRQERGQGELSAVQEVEAEFGLRCISLLTLGALIELLGNSARHDSTQTIATEHLPALHEYRARYGVAS